ncbi:iron-sulfur cluster-binding domain-containing protein [Microbacter sp. GSS18]|nr:iron-sulfur cluster-binding domain-containing protein [Microbacter sp. GSS18]
MLPAAGYRFVASGIGITPILPMIEHCEETGVPWSLDYIVRERGRAAYLDRLPERGVTLHITSEHGRPDLDAIAFGDGTGRRLYACGSTSLLVGLEEAARRVDAGPLHAEWFAPRPVVAAADARDEFEVAFNRSGVSAVVQAADSIVDAASRVGVDIPVSCSQGVCGSCETSLLGGVVDHRDSVLTDTERSEGLVMMPCVSRARSDTLVLDA